MPIPKPHKGEKEKDFMERCMGDAVMNREYEDASQRYAVCKTSWNKKKNQDEDNEPSDKEGDKTNDVKTFTNVIFAVDCEQAFTHSIRDNGDILIEGWFTTEKLNAFRQIVKASSFAWPGAMQRFNGRVLAFHNASREPIGVVEQMDIREDAGVYGKVRIFKENSDLMKRSIREGVLNGFSIGFGVEEYTYNEKEDEWTFTKCYLNELSVCHIGANDEATFKVINSLMAETKNQTERSTQVPLEFTEKDKGVILKLSDFDPNSIADKQAKLTDNVTELRQIQHTLKDEFDKLQGGSISKSEFAERMEKINNDITKIANDVETARNANAYDKGKVIYNDYRSLITDFVWLTNEAGEKVSEMAQRAYALFQMPVDYKQLNAGQELKNLRDLHDAVLLIDAINRFRSPNRHRITDMKLWKTLVQKTGMFDKELSHAMAGGNTGYGAEWIPEEFSSEFNEILRVLPTLPNKFQTWQMPKSGSAKYPFQNGKAVVYKGSEAIVNNPSEARKTNIATSSKTFTPEVFIGALVSSEELTEDSVIEMVAMIRKELAVALNEGLEMAIISGDDSGTHMDNAHTATHVPAYDVRTIFKGIRQLGDANHIDATTGVGNTTLQEIINTKNALGIGGLRANECLFVTGLNGRAQFQHALFDTDALGILAYMISGTLPPIGGSEVYVSGVYEEDLDADGYYNAGASKHTSAVCVHLPSFRIAQRRGVTLEYSKNILTQQQAFVATARWDFGRISYESAPTNVACASLIGIDYTA